MSKKLKNQPKKRSNIQTVKILKEKKENIYRSKIMRLKKEEKEAMEMFEKDPTWNTIAVVSNIYEKRVGKEFFEMALYNKMSIDEFISEMQGYINSWKSTDSMSHAYFDNLKHNVAKEILSELDIIKFNNENNPLI